MRSKWMTAFVDCLLLLGSFAMGNYAAGRSKKKGKVRWDYTIVRHAPHMREGESDFKKIRNLGSEGWELASSYPVKGEIVIPIMKIRGRGHSPSALGGLGGIPRFSSLV